MKKIYEHLHGKPLKNYDAAVTYATNNFLQAAENALRFLVNPSPKNHTQLKADTDYWHKFVSDWVADIELKMAVLQAAEEGKVTALEPHLSYLSKLTDNPNALPQDMAQPRKKDKTAAVLEWTSQTSQYLH